MIFTEDQVKSLTERQKANSLHPYTCDDGHDLIPTTEGWICKECDYKQDWAHGVDLNWGWKDLLGFPDLFPE